MKKLLIIAAALLVPSIGFADEFKLTMKEALEAKEALHTLMKGAERTIKEGERERVVREEFHFASIALDAMMAKNYVRLDQATRPIVEEVSALSKRLCPPPAGCVIDEKADNAVTKAKKTEALSQLTEDGRAAEAKVVTVEIGKVTEADLDGVTPKIPMSLRVLLAPITK